MRPKNTSAIGGDNVPVLRPWYRPIRHRIRGRFFHARHYYDTLVSLAKDAVRLFPRRERPPRLGTLFAGSTNICNAKCVFCAYKTSESPRGHLSFALFKKVADEYTAMGGEVIGFTPTVGDPLLDPHLFEKVAYALTLRGLKRMYFYTNGIMLQQKSNYRSIVDLKLPEVFVSMPEPDRVAYQEIFGVDAYRQVKAGLSLLLAYNRERGEPCQITIDFRSSIPPSRIFDLPDFKEVIEPYLGERVKVGCMVNYDNWGGVIRPEELRGSMRMRRIPQVKSVTCGRMDDIAILWNGKVRLCSCRILTTEFDELVIGDIGSQSLEEILASPQAKQVRGSFAVGALLPVCRDCSLYNTDWF